MIESKIALVCIVVAAIYIIRLFYSKYDFRILEFIPSIVVVYFLMMSGANLQIFSPDTVKYFEPAKNYILASMIFLMLLKSDIKSVYRMKTKLLVSFFAVSFSIMAGFVVMWAVMGDLFEPDAYKGFGALCGSWIGGTANMIAVASSVGVDGELMGYCLVTDSVCYGVWLMFLLFLVPYKDIFNRWSKADDTAIESVATVESGGIGVDFVSLFSALLLSVFAVYMAGVLPKGSFVGVSFWVVVIATVLGVAASATPMSKSVASEKVAFWLLYLLISLIALGSSFGDFAKAPLFIAAGFLVIFFHAVFAVLYAKIFRIDLFTIGVASLANIGGVASAPLLAASFDKNLVSVGVLMSMLGYIIGTFCGIGVTYILGGI